MCGRECVSLITGGVAGDKILQSSLLFTNYRSFFVFIVCMYRYFFVDEKYIFYEFYDKGSHSVYSILSHYKPGTKVNVTWKHHKQTWKKIILDAKNIPSYSGRHY